jgi:hypothetical protein
MPQFLAAAKYPNAALKATGAPSYSAESYPFRDRYGCIKQQFDAYGPQRPFWSTDITRMPCRSWWCITLFTEKLAWLKGRDFEQVMGRAVGDWFRWQR